MSEGASTASAVAYRFGIQLPAVLVAAGAVGVLSLYFLTATAVVVGAALGLATAAVVAGVAGVIATR
ncbi:hypothetical protein Hbl1158_11880 [Halobaculum sp. CBA1158]|uniref:hypothetical protein n=1 Tax=Halobaculum sp. CBA1158 TaxID=2904243 RepID=UPI001F353089|nr:hypothetical protein [Halobaculum sp. CBA1158]UIO99226.1 hypothetical protein Hbl1158_11880 [Halobaculum sp. CBA1158]